MKQASRTLAAVLILAWPGMTWAQSADEIIEKSVAALGGRPAHAKLQSRSAVGTIALSTPAGEIAGSIEMLTALPNKMRTLLKADLSALGAGNLVMDQRFDGSTGYVLDTLQGNHDITGNQLENMKNSSFPHPFLNYKALGISAKMTGKEKVGERDAFVVVFDPPTGSEVRQYIDAETYLPTRFVMTITVPQLGTDVEQTTDFSDFRDVDGVKVPFRVHASSSLQRFTITVTKVEHNVTVDPALFSKPAGR